MKILHVIAQKPDYTGSGIYVKNLIGWAGSRGHEQALVAAVEKGDSLPLSRLDEYLVTFGDEKLPFPLPGMSDEMPYPSTPYGSLETGELLAWEESFEQQLMLAKERFNPDVVIAHHVWLLTAKVREVFNDIPVMAICHGSDLRQMGKNKHLCGKVLPASRKLDRIFALNRFQKREIAAVYGYPLDKIVVSGIGYDDKLFCPARGIGPEKNGKRLIYAGKLARAKGLLSLFRIMERLRRDLDIQLSLAGSGDVAYWQELAPEGVDFLGRLSQCELANAFRESDIFVLPSYFEGLPLVALEALGSGVPVVMSDIPGVQNWLGPDIMESGYLDLVKLPTMEQMDEPVATELPLFEARFEAAIRRMLFKNKDHECMQRLAQQRSWDQVFEKIEEAMIYGS